MKTFSRDFGNGFICTVHAEDQPTLEAMHSYFKVQWSAGPPFPESIYIPWRDWINSISQELSNTWSIRLFHTFTNRKQKEVWVYDPGKQPKRLSEKESEIALLATAMGEHGQSAVRRHDGSAKSFVEQLVSFQKSFQVAHELNKIASDKIPTDSMTLKVETTEGKTHIVVNGLDSEIVANLPRDLAEIAADRHRDKQSLAVVESVEPGWVKAWFRQPEIDPKLGRWTYYEVKTPPEELRINPSGESAQAYCRMLALILGMVEGIFPGSSPGITGGLLAQGAILPGLSG